MERRSLFFTAVSGVKKRRRGVTRLSPKHQVTIPAAAVEQLGLVPGEELQVDVDAAGRIVLTRLHRVEQRRAAVAALDDRFTGVWTAGEIDRLRDEWRS